MINIFFLLLNDNSDCYKCLGLEKGASMYRVKHEYEQIKKELSRFYRENSPMKDIYVKMSNNLDKAFIACLVDIRNPKKDIDSKIKSNIEKNKYNTFRLLAGELEGPNYYKYLGVPLASSREILKYAYDKNIEYISDFYKRNKEFKDVCKKMYINLSEAYNIILANKEKAEEKRKSMLSA